MPWFSLNRAVRSGGVPRGWWSLFVTGVISALIIPLLLIVLGLIAELLTTRGRLELPAAQAGGIAEWAGAPDGETELGVQYRDRGLLPLVFRYRSMPVLGGSLVRRYGSSPWMQANQKCLLVLLLFGTLLAALESLTLGLFYLSRRRAALDVGCRLRGAIYDQAFHLGVFDLLGDRVTQAERLIVEQAPQVEEGLERWWRAVARSACIVVTSLLLAMVANLWITLVSLLLGTLLWLLHTWLNGRTEDQTRLGTDRAARELDRLREQLRQVPLVAGYLLNRIPGEPRDETLQRFRQQAEQATTVGIVVRPFFHFCVVLGAALIVLLVGMNVLREAPGMTVSEAVVLGGSLVVAFFPLRQLYRMRELLPEAERAATAIFAYLDREPAFAEAADARPLGRIRDKLELASVTLADRHGSKLLDSVSLTIPTGVKTAVVASDASVPIALAGLLARFYDPAAGRVLCDGQDIRSATLHSLRRQVTVVTGNGQLFSGTVSDNIACGEERYTQVQITDAAKQARGYNFIQQLPQGFATIVGQQGRQLDAGQAFRIALARIALRDPSAMVVQEPRAEIGDEARGQIDEALRRLAPGRAVLLLPARLETLRSADHVVLIHQGKVVGEGTHTELIQASELYRHLTYVRFNPYRGQVDAE